MGIQEFPLIDGQIVSWAEIGLSLEVMGGVSFQTKDFSAVSFSDKLDPGKVRGVGPRIIGRTVGEYDCDASLSMYFASFIYFQRALGALADSLYNGRVGLVPFDVPISWEPLGAVGEVFGAKLVGCRIAGRDFKASPSPDASVVEVPLSITRLEIDGRSLV